MALLGVAVTVAGSTGGGSLFGDGLALMMAVAMSTMTVVARRHVRLPALLTACVCSLAGALAVLPLGLLSGASFILTWQAMAWLAGFGVTTMAIALPCYLSAPLWVWLAFAEVPSNASLIGGGIVALAIGWQLRSET